MSRWEYYQPNTRNKKEVYDDSILRAVARAFDMTWDQAFDTLIPIARELGTMPYDPKCFNKFFKDSKIPYTTIKNPKGSVRPTVKSFVDSHPEGVYVLRVANHLVTCVDGVYYDTWDSGNKSMYGYWEVSP